MFTYVRRIVLPDDCSAEKSLKTFVENLVANGGQLQSS